MMKSLEVLQQNPGLAAFNMQMDALEKFLQKKTTLVLDTEHVAFAMACGWINRPKKDK